MTVPTTGTIHDIGYRHFEGRRLGRAYQLRSLYVHNLRAAYGLGRPARAKVMPFILVAIMLLPAAADVAVVAITKQSESLWRYSAYIIYFQVVIAIFLATQAPVLASRELRFRVVPLYFSRPVGALDFVLAKYAALATALFALTAVPVLVLYVGGMLTEIGFSMTHVWRFAGALVGCVLLAMLLAAFGLLVAAFTPRRGLGVTAVIATYMVTSAFVTIVQNIAEENFNFTLSRWMGLFTPFNLVDTIQVRLLGLDLSAIAVPPSPLGGPIALAMWAGLIAAALTILFRRFQRAGNL